MYAPARLYISQCERSEKSAAVSSCARDGRENPRRRYGPAGAQDRVRQVHPLLLQRGHVDARHRHVRPVDMAAGRAGLPGVGRLPADRRVLHRHRRPHLRLGARHRRLLLRLRLRPPGEQARPARQHRTAGPVLRLRTGRLGGAAGLLDLRQPDPAADPEVHDEPHHQLAARARLGHPQDGAGKHRLLRRGRADGLPEPAEASAHRVPRHRNRQRLLPRLRRGAHLVPRGQVRLARRTRSRPLHGSRRPGGALAHPHPGHQEGGGQRDVQALIHARSSI